MLSEGKWSGCVIEKKIRQQRGWGPTEAVYVRGSDFSATPLHIKDCTYCYFFQKDMNIPLSVSFSHRWDFISVVGHFYTEVSHRQKGLKATEE